MPIDSLPVPLFEQESDGACLPACARMVLAYLGLAFAEAHLAQVLGFRQFSLRGQVAAAGEWCLVCLAFNLKRLHTLITH